MPQRQSDKEKNGMGNAANCAKTAWRLSIYLDGGMDAAERDGMNQHFADCADCRMELARQRQAESALTAARFALPQAGDLRADFYARLQNENSARSKRPAINWRLAVPALASAGLAAVLWRPGADVPLIRNENTPALSIAPRSNARLNSAKREPLRRGISPALSALKPALRASGHSLLRVAETSVFAKKAPEMPAPPSPILRRYAQNLALESDTAKTAGDAPRRLASAEESERIKSLYGMPASFGLDLPQSALSKGETFYFRAQAADADTLIKSAKRDDWAAASDEYLAFGASRFSASLVAGPGIPESSAALGLPTMLADAAPASGSTALAEAPVAIQIAAGTRQELDRAKAETSAPDEVDFEVRDDERGFVSRMKVTGRIEQQPDGETLTIEAEADNGS